jgi:hypothetical protein
MVLKEIARINTYEITKEVAKIACIGVSLFTF